MKSATVKPDLIIDSHSHWGPSISMGMEVSTAELLRQLKESGIDYVAVIPFPSTAIANNKVNVDILAESDRVGAFIPYHYVRENFETEGFDPIPLRYIGGKWHWMRGWQDSASNYRILDDSDLPGLVEKIRRTGKPVIFEEELNFTRRFVDMFPGLPLIIPHLGLLGGYPDDFLESFKKDETIRFDTALGGQDTIHEFITTIGPERVLFGSDVPFGAMRSELAKVLALPLNDDDRDLVLAGNFMRLTGWKP
jgi:uncharacterized protein